MSNHWAEGKVPDECLKSDKKRESFTIECGKFLRTYYEESCNWLGNRQQISAVHQLLTNQTTCGLHISIIIIILNKITIISNPQRTNIKENSGPQLLGWPHPLSHNHYHLNTAKPLGCRSAGITKYCSRITIPVLSLKSYKIPKT